jgi:hypothetical protein
MGAGDWKSFVRERKYTISARVTGSPSLTKDMKSDFRREGLLGFERGRRETGGAPKVMQWMRLKRFVSSLSSVLDSRLVESI